MNSNPLSDRDKELEEFAKLYEAAMSEDKPLYMDADDWADLADWYGTKKYYAKAFEIAECGLKQHPDSTPLMVEYAYLHLDSGKKKKARDIVDSLTDTYSPEVKIVTASVLLAEGKQDEAENLLSTIEDKEDLSNIVDIAYMYMDIGYLDKAFEWFEPVKDLYADEELYIALTADYHYAKGTIDESAALYNKLIDKNPYSSIYWYGLARCYFDQQKLDQAIDACDYALVSNDDFADAHAMKGHCFYQLGNVEMAQECYKRAQELHGVEPGFLYSFIGLNKTTQKEWAEAYENLEKAIRINEAEEIPSTLLPNLYANAGLCLFKLGNSAKAHHYCQKAQEMRPDDTEPYLIEGRIYSEEGDFRSGEAMWDKALELDPSAETWHEIGMYSLDLGNMICARDAFERACDLNPDFEGVNEKLAIVYLALHDKGNFIKYNDRCTTPISIEKLKQMQALLEDENQVELAAYIQNVIRKRE